MLTRPGFSVCKTMRVFGFLFQAYCKHNLEMNVTVQNVVQVCRVSKFNLTLQCLDVLQLFYLHNRAYSLK